MKPKHAISLFSGAGGMDIGVSNSGFQVDICIEQDPYACETLRHNIALKGKPTRVIESDIRNIDPAEILASLGLVAGEIDLLFGGPPCQAFSQIGKQLSLDDDRGMLLFEMIRFAKTMKPRVILIEQVKGLLNAIDQYGKRGGVFDKLLAELNHLGYGCTWKIINAADYGVPQKRERVFIIALQSGLEFDFPLPTHGVLEENYSLFPLRPYQNVGDALHGLGDPMLKNGHVPVDSHVDVTPHGDRLRIHGVFEGSHLAASFHLPPEQRQKLTKKDTTKFRRLSWLTPSLTLRCGEIFYHPTEDRYLTPREYMRLHGYPDDYFLKGPVRGRSGQARHLDQHRQIANSVPPPIAETLALAIRKALDVKDF